MSKFNIFKVVPQKIPPSKKHYFLMFVSAFFLPFSLVSTMSWNVYLSLTQPLAATFVMWYLIVFGLTLLVLVVVPLILYIRRSNSVSDQLLNNPSSQISDNRTIKLSMSASYLYYYFSNFGWVLLFLWAGAVLMRQFYRFADGDFETNTSFYIFLRDLLLINEKPTFAMTLIKAIIFPIILIVLSWLIFSSINSGNYSWGDEEEKEKSKPTPTSLISN